MANLLGVDLHKVVPRLKEELNYDAWARAFEFAMKSRGLGYWEILTGDLTAPSRPDLYPTDANAVQQELLDDDISEADITPAFIRDRQTRNEERNVQLMQRWREEKEKFQQKSYLILLLLNSTLETGPLSHIGDLQDPAEIWDLLQVNHQCRSPQSCRHLIFKLSNMKYTESTNCRTFIQKFKDIIAELRLIVDVPVWVEYSHFLNAVSTNPSLIPFTTQTEINYDIETLESMTRIYIDFNNFEMARKSNSISANLTNTIL